MVLAMPAPTGKEASAAPKAGFRVGAVAVDPGTGEISGPAGREKLDPKVMGVFLMLAKRAGQVVSREELLAQLWPGVVVSDDAITRCLYELRRQLSAASGNDELRALVETLPKRGYRLNAGVAPLAAPDPPRTCSKSHTPRRLAWIAGGLAAFAAIAVILALVYPGRPAIPRVAVLPFVDMSPTKDQGFLADGITEEILDRLSNSPDLKVTARTSSFSFRGQSPDIAEIARKLDVDYVLEGSVRKAGDRIRVTAQFIDTADSTHLWSRTYERTVADYFAIQDEIAAGVAETLEASLTGPQIQRSTENLDALAQYAQGKFFYHRHSAGDIERAIEAFESAVALDPRYAQAWAALSGAYSLLANEKDAPDAALRRKQGEAAQRAVSLNPQLAIAHNRLGRYYWETGNLEQAEREFSQAMRLGPDQPLNLARQAGAAVWRGDLRAAIATQRRIVAADPMALSAHRNLASTLVADGQYASALAEYQLVREIAAGADPSLDTDVVRVLVLLRRYPEAEALVAGMPPGKRKDYGLALLYEAPGRRLIADAAFARLAGARYDSTSRDGTLDTVLFAEACAIRGRYEEAFGALQGRMRALKAEPRWITSNIALLILESRLSPFLKPLWSDPQRKEFLAGAG